jgi:hypothetical protein
VLAGLLNIIPNVGPTLSTLFPISAALLEAPWKAVLVLIAHDVDPIEIVIWLPALCKKMGVPYCIVKVMAAPGGRRSGAAERRMRASRSQRNCCCSPIASL